MLPKFQIKIEEGKRELDSIIKTVPDRCLDVIGFSRGGVLAMDFVNKVKQNSEYKSVKIRFVGLFDPVRGADTDDRKRTHIGNEHIQNLAIAYAANERRVLFLPRYYKGANETTSYIRYFAGSHSDVGGRIQRTRGCIKLLICNDGTRHKSRSPV